MDLERKDKVEKYDEIIQEYKRLVCYRNNLAATVLMNVESMYYESVVFKRSYINDIIVSDIDKKLDPESIRSIQKEIENTDIIISFIGSIVNKEQTVRDGRDFDLNEPSEPSESND